MIDLIFTFKAFEFSRSETNHMLYSSRRTGRLGPSSLSIFLLIPLSLCHLHLKALYFFWARNCRVLVLKWTRMYDSSRGNMAMGIPARLWTAPWILHFNLLKHFKAEEQRFKGLALPEQSSGRIFNIILDLSSRIISESMNHVSFTLHNSYYWKLKTTALSKRLWMEILIIWAYTSGWEKMI